MRISTVSLWNTEIDNRKYHETGNSDPAYQEDRIFMHPVWSLL
jgi:hypothetical protein